MPTTDYKNCPACDGAGISAGEPCVLCNGTGSYTGFEDERDADEDEDEDDPIDGAIIWNYHDLVDDGRYIVEDYYEVEGNWPDDSDMYTRGGGSPSDADPGL
jgi:hypothetical protein